MKDESSFAVLRGSICTGCERKNQPSLLLTGFHPSSLILHPYRVICGFSIASSHAKFSEIVS